MALQTFHDLGLVPSGSKEGALLGILGCGLGHECELGWCEVAGILCLEDGIDGQRLFLLLALKNSSRTQMLEAAVAIP